MEVVPRPDVAKVLGRLKDFQRDTVDYVFGRMYEDYEPAKRFLVADEVGLGKTLVAAGVIARAVDRLWDTTQRIDIVYVCSNAAIARQNVTRLRKVLGGHAAVLPSRITLLPRVVRDLTKRRLNLVSFTPGTSFDLKSSLGTADERALLYWLVPDDWKEHERGTISLLTGSAARAGFEARVKEYLKRYPIDQGLRDQFRASLTTADGRALRNRFLALAEALGGRASLSDEEWRSRSSIVGELRGALAAACIESLEPDLVVLDEFQRFKHLLSGEDEASELARKLFDYRDPRTGQDARVLLLSATPYKMYTLADEIDAEDHFKDFIGTVGFLQGEPSRTEAFSRKLKAYRQALFQYSPGADNLGEHKRGIEDALRRVMVRTERLSVRGDRNGMLVEVPPRHIRLAEADLHGYLAVQAVGRLVEQGDVVEYWKSAPYLLNFMEEYQLKRSFEEAVQGPEGAPIYQALASASSALLSWDDVQAYRKIDPGNARLRNLFEDVDGHHAWSMFWLPPALPYYTLSGEFANGSSNFTKRLIFSSWQVVPKVVAALLSYEAERRLQGMSDEGVDNSNTAEARRRRRPLLRFSRSDGRLTGMPVLALLYPSTTLARRLDPLAMSSRLLANGGETTPVQLDEVLAETRRQVELLLADLPDGGTTGAEDESWYWAAPILLDLQHDRDATQRWLGQHDLKVRWRESATAAELVDPTLAEEGDEPEDEAWSGHVDEVHALRNGTLTLGRRPSDLAQVLTLMAVAGPANVALRAVARVTCGLPRASELQLRTAAGRVAEGFRTLFNAPDVTAFIRKNRGEDAYWRSVLEYCAAGCLQAVMDEYAHTAAELISAPRIPEAAADVAKEMIIALTLRTANLGVDIIRLEETAQQVRVLSEPRGFRARFALRFGERKGEDGAVGIRQEAVRKAFNSPFWPFVLCSTSVGQEGLDFHPYCHAIVHWNLPANPVDLEQREGRIHRYKGHAVRKNIARQHGGEAVRDSKCGEDPWTALFQIALGARQAHDRDLVPFWVYTTEDGAHIERHIPALPLSRDVERAKVLRRALVVYRMAFGQNRQEDLLAYLTSRIPADEIDKVAEQLRIDLSPPRTAITWSESSAVDDNGEVEARVEVLGEDEPPSDAAWNPNLDALRDLLDQVHALTTGTQQVADIAVLRELLDRARTLILQQTVSTDTERLKDVLDRFAALKALVQGPQPSEDLQIT